MSAALRALRAWLGQFYGVPLDFLHAAGILLLWAAPRRWFRAHRARRRR